MSFLGDLKDQVSDAWSGLKDGGITDFRDAVETVAVLALNYFYPGSALLTSKLVSDGAQENLGGEGGKMAMLVTGAAGAYQGNMSNYGKLFGSGASGGTTGGTGLATDTQSTGLIGANTSSSLDASASINGAAAGTQSAAASTLASTPPATTTSTLASTPSITPTINTGINTKEAAPGMWDKIGTFLDKPSNVTALGFGLQGIGAGMAGAGAKEQARLLKERQDYERAQNERQLANINGPAYNPVRVKPKPTGLINANQQMTSKGILT